MSESIINKYYEPLHFEVQKMIAQKEAILGMLDAARDLIQASPCDHFVLKMDFKELVKTKQQKLKEDSK